MSAHILQMELERNLCMLILMLATSVNINRSPYIFIKRQSDYIPIQVSQSHRLSSLGIPTVSIRKTLLNPPAIPSFVRPSRRDLLYPCLDEFPVGERELAGVDDHLALASSDSQFGIA